MKKIYVFSLLLSMIACSFFSETNETVTPFQGEQSDDAPNSESNNYKKVISLSDGIVRDWELSPDGKYFAVATSRGVILIDVSYPSEKKHIMRGNFSEIAISPDSKWLAFLEIPTMDQDGSYRGDEEVYLVELPDGDIIDAERYCDDGGYDGSTYCNNDACYEYNPENDTIGDLICEGSNCDFILYNACDAEYFSGSQLNIAFTTDNGKLVYQSETGYTMYDLLSRKHEFIDEIELSVSIFTPLVSGNEYQNAENVILPSPCITQENQVIEVQICINQDNSGSIETTFVFSSLAGGDRLGEFTISMLDSFDGPVEIYRNNLFFTDDRGSELKLGLISPKGGITIFGLKDDEKIYMDGSAYSSMISSDKCAGQGTDDETLKYLNTARPILSPDRTKLFVIGSHEIKMISLTQGGELSITIDSSQYISMGFSQDGKVMALYYYDCQTRPLGVELRNVADLGLINQITEVRHLGKSPLENLYPGYLEIFTILNRGDFSPDSSKMAVGLYENGIPKVGIFSASNGSYISGFELPENCYFYSWADSDSIALGCDTSSIQDEPAEGFRVVNLDTGKTSYTVLCSYNASSAITRTGFSYSGNFFLCNDEVGGKTSIIRPSDNTEMYSQDYSTSVYDRIYFSQEGNYLGIETYEQLKIYKLPEWVEVNFGEYFIYNGLAEISPDEKMLAVAVGSGDIEFYDLPTGKFIGYMAGFHNGSLLDMEFSPDSKLIASFSRDGSIVIQPVNPEQ